MATDITMEKEFVINGFVLNGKPATISRADYENMPCAMMAKDWTDEQMEMLAKGIAAELAQYSFDVESDYYEDECSNAFWKEMENVAVRLGMTYYEDYNYVEVEWDVDDDDNPDLPEGVYVPCDVEEEDIADWLSDEYGYCVLSFDIDN